VFERFTERARRVIILAREEAGRFRHDFVGTEHILLGLIRDGEGIATAVLQRASAIPPGAMILPFAVPVSEWESKDHGEIWSIYADGKLTDSDGAEVPGNWGTVDIGPTKNSTNLLRDQINSGLHQADLDALQADGRISSNDEIGAKQQFCANGNPGMSIGMKDAIRAAQGSKRVVPLFDALGTLMIGTLLIVVAITLGSVDGSFIGLFYGAPLSVIMSTASGTLLAPSVTLSENVLKGWITRKNLSDRKMLVMTRWVVGIFALCVTIYALWALDRDTGIHQMVENAYKVTLVLAFTPLVAGLYWKRATTYGAYWAMGLGLATWLPMEFIAPEAALPPQFAGFLMSIVGMLGGSLLHRQPEHASPHPHEFSRTE